MNSGATADRVYVALKQRLLSGAIGPGDKLEPARIADDLNSSVTPIRDALHRLVGERLVAMWSGEGFHAPMPTEPGVRDLYLWNAGLTRLIVQSWSREANRAAASDLPIDIERATPALFEALAARSANGEFRAQVESASDRLATARAAERTLLADLEDELRSLAVTCDRESTRRILNDVARYHRRRIRAVPALVRAMYERRWTLQQE